MKALEPIDTRPLFSPLHRELTELLRGLDDRDGARPTVAGRWRVRDVVAHLLDVQARDVSVLRDGHVPPPDGSVVGYESLVAFLDRLNADWLRATERLSLRMLLDLLDTVGEQAAAVLEEQPLHAEATFPVDWAGADPSRQWMHVGRQYTEYWHHQMQIRDAVGVPRLLGERWLRPLVDLSIRALPRTYEALEAPLGTTLTLTVDTVEDEPGESVPLSWTLTRTAEGWSLSAGAPERPTTTVRFTADESWRLFYNARSPDAARRLATISGVERWAEPLWRTRSVMVKRLDP